MLDNLAWEIGYASKTGPKKVNEDRCMILYKKIRDQGHIILALVADGMGGHELGDRASEIVLRHVENWWDTSSVVKPGSSVDFSKVSYELERLFKEINNHLNMIRYHEGFKLGTTLSLVFIHHHKYIVKHVGDSRVYHMTDDERPIRKKRAEARVEGPGFTLNQLTEDDSWVSYQIRQGNVKREEALHHPKRHILMQCLGIDEEVEVHETRGEFKEGEMFVLCSDGFYSLYPPSQFPSLLLSQSGTLKEFVPSLVEDAARSEQATDNLTLVMLKSPKTKQPKKSRWKQKVMNFFS
ncbi:PP2C family protein-serine/threonine phosphatase [Pontibacillus chungwhensis]|uniref:Serine/threonine-protein phosphatase n=2 Tax=Pontibacillus TaxID=289201 RepID=A0ABY8V3Q0_9BACI|nr:PP2C family serine/threonine-protein phosphatase [Pontibacillus chungwhensis]WIG00264.1 serine/threonine-protein phosphatase [Pontibacillus chungwhensis]